MGREIKFRGRRIDNGQWVYGQYFVAPLTDENSGLPPEAGWYFLSGSPPVHCIVQDGVSFVIDENTLGQYTGLKDKNGVEIYEGDILDTEQGNYRVYWSEDWAVFGVNGTELFALMWWASESKVVGNVHENANLLVGDSQSEY